MAFGRSLGVWPMHASEHRHKITHSLVTQVTSGRISRTPRADDDTPTRQACFRRRKYSRVSVEDWVRIRTAQFHSRCTFGYRFELLHPLCREVRPKQSLLLREWGKRTYRLDGVGSRVVRHLRRFCRSSSKAHRGGCSLFTLARATWDMQDRSPRIAIQSDG